MAYEGPGPSLTWAPVSGFEPLACRLQEARPGAPDALAAAMTWAIAPTALMTLGLSGEPVHAGGEKWTHDCNRARRPGPTAAATQTHRHVR